MKIVKSQTKKVVEAVEAVKELENKTGVKVQTGLRAGAGGGGTGGGGVYQPLYGAPLGDPV
jgi:hypothetical protein